MGKKCSVCGFNKNPEEANYCGKCGSNIAYYGSKWELFDSTYWKVLPNKDYQEYKKLSNK
ncbi:MAG: hypothetical protein IAA73_09380 [Bacteroidetes bacterium]|uniref:Uncharacterized protein n=1 Tax=Candidatus Gallipaludibacter merdavium TaxID=2840839 RepID=A0A9D9HUG1_9BACT|nr:hypothetical protein [Candidatus Gallipaludibacter merdavium]